MKTKKLFAAIVGIAILGTTSSAFAQGPILSTPGAPHVPHTINPQKKAASDQAMQTGLGQLNAAAAALSGGNASSASSDLQSAVTSMNSALGIYDGYREKSIHSAGAAIKVLGSNRKNALNIATKLVGRAISDAQTALTKN